MLPPEIIVTIEKVDTDPEDDRYLVVTATSAEEEICRKVFRFDPELLIDLEPQWMLEKAGPRYSGESINRGPADAARLDEEEEKLATYGQRLYGFLFGDGNDLNAFLGFN